MKKYEFFYKQFNKHYSIYSLVDQNEYEHLGRSKDKALMLIKNYNRILAWGFVYAYFIKDSHPYEQELIQTLEKLEKETDMLMRRL